MIIHSFSKYNLVFKGEGPATGERVGYHPEVRWDPSSTPLREALAQRSVVPSGATQTTAGKKLKISLLTTMIHTGKQIESSSSACWIYCFDILAITTVLPSHASP